MDIENVKMTTMETSSMRLRACFASMIWLMLFLALLPAVGWAANLPSTALGGESAPFEQGIQEIRYPEEPAAVVAQRHQALLDKARTEGAVSVIVRLRQSLLPEARLHASSVQQQRDQLAQMQERVLNRLSTDPFNSRQRLHVKRFRLTPAFAIWADEHVMRELLADPEVLEIVEDGLNTPTLSQSVPLIGGGPLGDFAGLTGQGWTVAVLDTGVEKNHPFLSGKVVSEACYSSPADEGLYRFSLCPDGAASSTDTNSGAPCDSHSGVTVQTPPTGTGSAAAGRPARRSAITPAR